jgi:putative lipoic acid-binding regulatory protein
MTDDSLLQFPCDFPIKIIGVNADGFAELVLETITGLATLATEDAYVVRSSRAGNYLSISCTVQAQNRTQIDALYAALTSLEGVRFVI